MNVKRLTSVKAEFNMLLENGTFKSPADVETASTANMLAKIVDILDMEATQQIIRKWIHRNCVTLGALVEVLDMGQRAQRIGEIKEMSNSRAEEYLLFGKQQNKTYMISAQVLIARLIMNSPNGNKKVTPDVLAKRYANVSKLMWDQLMYELGKRDDLVGYFGAVISSNIVLKLANQRSDTETKFLSDKDMDILQKIATELNAMYIVPSDKTNTQQMQILNLEKHELVEVITSMNSIARETSKTKLAECLKTFDTYHSSDKLVTENHTGIKGALSKEYVNKQLGPELEKLATVVARYTDASNYFLATDAAENKEFCEVEYHDGSMPDCSNTIKRLHVYARKITEAADTCSTVIEAGEKANLNERYRTNKATGILDKARGWLHSR